MSIIQDIKNIFTQKNKGVYRLIAINVAVFLVMGFVSVLQIMFNASFAPLDAMQRVLGVPALVPMLPVRFYSLLTYMFVHSGFLHLAFNMLWLYWIGNDIFADLVGSKKVVACYLLGGVAAALFFVAAYNFFPLYATAKNGAYLVGASGSVLAVLAATATLVPNFEMRLLLFGNVKLKYVVLVPLVLDLLQITGSNGGGHLAHLGGAAFGYLYMQLMQRGTDLSQIIYAPAKWLKNLTAPRHHTHLVVVQVTQKTAENDNTIGNITKEKAPNTQQQIDEILDKISVVGYEKLTQAEKEKLFQLSNKP